MKTNLKILLIAVLAISCTTSGNKSNETESIKIIKDASYRADNITDEYEKERCKLDLYLPANKTDFPVLVWFHGGSLKHGSKDGKPNIELASNFAKKGIAVATVNYRLSPRVTYPAYIDDAAAAVAWVAKNIENYGGNEKKVFMVGHSAGAYLVLMLALDSTFLQKYDCNYMNVAGVIPLSGQTMTHYTVREEMGIENPEETPLVNEAAPQFHAKKRTPPMLIVCGDKDSPDRKEENRVLIELLEEAGNTKIVYKEINNRTHWGLVKEMPSENDPLAKEIMAFININMKEQIK